MRKPVIGVMGAGDNATETDAKRAFELGKLIAQQGWIVLSGGRNVGVMDAVNKGAKEEGGMTIAILPGKDNSQTSEAVDIAIITGMGSARNTISALSSDIIIAVGMGTGTSSEISIALKEKKHVILLNDHQESKAFFRALQPNLVHVVTSPQEAIEKAWKILG